MSIRTDSLPEQVLLHPSLSHVHPVSFRIYGMIFQIMAYSRWNRAGLLQTLRCGISPDDVQHVHRLLKCGLHCRPPLREMVVTVCTAAEQIGASRSLSELAYLCETKGSVEDRPCEILTYLHGGRVIQGEHALRR